MTRETSIDAPTRQLLRRLATPGAWLVALPGDAAGGDEPYRLMSSQAGKSGARFSGRLVQCAARNGWITQGDGRMVLSPQGARSLRRALSGGGEIRVPNEASPAPAKARERSGLRAPTEQAPGLNEAESPLGWLRRRKDKSGEPLIGDAQFSAGERLRADVFFAGLSARVTMNWSPSEAGMPSRRAAPGGSAGMLDSMVAARQRIDKAMVAVGPEMSGLLLDVCGFLKGLECVEAERGWPARSGKIVLLQALSMLARHYGLTRLADNRNTGASDRPGRLRHWGADGYRPDTSAWQEGDDDPAANGGAESQGRETRH